MEKGREMMHYTESYKPGDFLDRLQEEMNCPTDAGLARALELTTSHLSKIRHNKVRMGAGVLLKVHTETGIPLKDLKLWAGIT